MKHWFPCALLFGAAFGAAVFLSAPSAAQSKVDPLIIGVGTAVSQSMLLPGYISTVYYGANSHKPMPGGWLTGNLLGSAAALSAGLLLLYGSESANSGRDAAGYIVAGSAAVLGAGVVTVASFLQYSREDLLPMIVVTPAGLRCWPSVEPRPAAATLVLAGVF